MIKLTSWVRPKGVPLFGDVELYVMLLHMFFFHDFNFSIISEPVAA